MNPEPTQGDKIDEIVKLVFERGVGAYNMPDEKYLAQKDATRLEAKQALTQYIDSQVREAIQKHDQQLLARLKEKWPENPYPKHKGKIVDWEPINHAYATALKEAWSVVEEVLSDG